MYVPPKKKLRGFSPQANYTNRATAGIELNIFHNFKMAANTSSVKMSYCFKTFLYFLMEVVQF
jgi:hypothetical protein